MAFPNRSDGPAWWLQTTGAGAAAIVPSARSQDSKLGRRHRSSRYASGMTTLLVADDHPLFRRALAQAVRERIAVSALHEAGTLDQARALLQTHPDIDLLLLDLHMPGSRGLMGLAGLRAEFPATAVVMISAHEDPRTVRRALAMGAAGFIPKSTDPDVIGEAVNTLLAGGEWLPEGFADPVAGNPDDEGERLAARLANLTAQQHRVLALVADGLLNKQIADRLGIQERTVKAHLTAIFERLEVRNRTQAGILLRSLDQADPSRDLP